MMELLGQAKEFEDQTWIRARISQDAVKSESKWGSGLHFSELVADSS
jgi:hypothetical protein